MSDTANKSVTIGDLVDELNFVAESGDVRMNGEEISFKKHDQYGDIVIMLGWGEPEEFRVVDPTATIAIVSDLPPFPTASQMRKALGAEDL